MSRRCIVANNYTVLNSLGISLTFRSTDDGSGFMIPNIRLCDATATNFANTGDAAARANYVYVTNGTQTLPTMDAAARSGYVTVTDRTNSITVKAASTAALVTDTALVVRPMMGTDGTNTAPTMDAIARAGFQELTDGTTGPVAVKAATTAAAGVDKALVVVLSPNNNALLNGDGSATGGTLGSKSVLAGAQYLAWASLPVATTGQQASLQMDIAGNQKVCVVPRGTVLYASATSSATTTATNTLTIPAGKMGYLDGFDIDGLGATAGAALAVTVTGLAGGTLTFDVGIPAGATVPITPASKRFNPPLQGTTTGVNIVLSVPGFGSGNTAFSANTYGGYI